MENRGGASVRVCSCCGSGRVRSSIAFYAKFKFHRLSLLCNIRSSDLSSLISDGGIDSTLSLLSLAAHAACEVNTL